MKQVFALLVVAALCQSLPAQGVDWDLGRRVEALEVGQEKLQQRVVTLEKQVKALRDANYLRNNPTVGATTSIEPTSPAVTEVGRPVQINGTWYNRMSDGSLQYCVECNRGRANVQVGGFPYTAEVGTPFTYGGQVFYAGVGAGDCATGNCASSAGMIMTGGPPVGMVGSPGRVGLFRRLFGGRCN